MRKKFFIYTFALMILSFAFASCSKEDIVPDSLVGTTWTYGNNFDVYCHLKFPTSQDFVIKYYWFGTSFSSAGTYSYSKPDVKMIVTKRDSIASPVSPRWENAFGTITGNKLTIVSVFDILEYIRQ